MEKVLQCSSCLIFSINYWGGSLLYKVGAKRVWVKLWGRWGGFLGSRESQGRDLKPN